MTKGSEPGMIVILSGPSGSGKTTICSRILAETSWDRSVSVTTRPPRPGEAGGKDYWFTDRQDFLRKVQEGYFAEHAEYCGHLYGTPCGPLEEAVAEGRIIFLVIEVEGARQIRRRFPEALGIFIMPPSSEEAARRLEHRSQDSAAEIARRQQRAEFELGQTGQYDHVVVNDDLDAAAEKVKEIVAAEISHRQNAGASL